MSSYALVPLGWLVLLELWTGARALRALARVVWLFGLGVLIRAGIVD